MNDGWKSQDREMGVCVLNQQAQLLDQIMSPGMQKPEGRI